MATNYLEKSQLRIVFETGMDMSTQKPILKRKSFTNIKTNARATELYSVAQSLSNLQKFSLYKVERVDQSNIED